MPGRIEPAAGSINRYKYGFNGKENDKETVGTGEGTQDYGMRIYNPALGKFLSIDPDASKFPFQSSYVFAANNPVLCKDEDGRYAVSVHYLITYMALRKLGYSEVRADLMAHFSSVYADHPTENVLFWDNYMSYSNNSYRDGIDYSPTRYSQAEASSTWHSMMSNKEAEDGMTEEFALQRGLSFGWDNIFSQKNNPNDATAGQGFHALEDAIAHGGAKTDDHLGHNFSSVGMVGNDIFGDAGNTVQADIMAISAGLVYGLMRGDAMKIEDNMLFTTQGMSKNQIMEVDGLLKDRGFYLSPFEGDAWHIYKKNVEVSPIVPILKTKLD